MTQQVIVTCMNTVDNSIVVLPLQRSTTFNDVRAAWSAKTDANPDEYQFREFGEDVLPVNGSLSQILKSGAFSISLVVEPYGSLFIVIYGMPNVRTSVQTCASTTPADIIRHVSEQFNLEDRLIRLFFIDKLLQHDITFVQQEVPFGAELVADLHFTFTIKTVSPTECEYPQSDTDDEDDENVLCDSGSESESEPETIVHPDECLSCFGTEFASFLLDENTPSSEQRLLIENVVVDQNSPIITALLRYDPLHQSTFHISREFSFTIQVQSQRRITCFSTKVLVWPSQKMHILIANARERIFYEGNQINPQKTFHEADVRRNGLVNISELIALTVKLINGTFRRIHISANATVSELRQLLAPIEIGGNFVMRYNDRTLSDEPHSLSSNGIGNGMMIKLSRAAKRVTPQYSELGVQTLFRGDCETKIYMPRKKQLSLEGPKGLMTEYFRYKELATSLSNLNAQNQIILDIKENLIKESSNHIQQQQQELQAKDTAMRDLQTQSARQQQELQAKDTAMRDLQAQSARQRQELQAKDAAMRDLRQKYLEQQNENEYLKKSMNELNIIKANLERDLRSQRDECEDLVYRNNSLQESVDRKKEKIKDIRKNFNEMRFEYQKLYDRHTRGEDVSSRPSLYGRGHRHVRTNRTPVRPPPPPISERYDSPGSREFRILDEIRSGHYIDCCLRLPPSATVGDVRVALARELRVPATKVTMERWEGVAVPWGAKVVSVGNQICSLGLYADTSERICSRESVNDLKFQKLSNDEENFAAPLRRRSILLVKTTEKR